MGNSACTCKRCCPCCPPKNEERKKVYKSIYDYPSRTIWDLNLTKGDILEVTGENEHWLYVRRRTAKANGSKDFVEEKGYVPKDFIKPLGSVEAELWYFESVKACIEAKRCLLRPENKEGAFLIWKCEENNQYYLSVRNGLHARHYRVKQGENDKNFFLVHHKIFQNLPDLIKFYSENESGLCAKLQEPCVKLDQPAPLTLSFETKWEVDRSSLKKIKKVGSGEFAEVWQGLWNNTTEVAIKEFKDVNYSSIKTEIDIMKELHHERLLKLYAVCTNSQPMCLVTELMKNGSLKKFLINHKHKQDLEFSIMMDFAVQITEGMMYIENKIVHRDLRAENILLTDMQCCKIADFGLAEINLPGSHRISSDIKVPVKWMAPEIFENKAYTSKSDVWSFGILLTEIVTYGDDPYPGMDKKTCVQSIQRGERMERPAGCPEALYEIMLRCWRSNPEERPTFTELRGKLMALINEPDSELE
ncbi:tyrosine-protein kinase SRK2 [Carassius gibelio]|uniref:tyrosine-protein kinase SRK2 n=1 Tax=Carassius gibelio TaxID=101364 RepID=UPI00227742FA|nr:tyrosine-protein kinase SRK2 [Carassius gibelio]XP_052436626.1 tyrosine-protein kinase SRK2 [Carassius gibelio]